MKEKSKKLNTRFHRPQKPNADLTFLQIRDIMQVTAIIQGCVKMEQTDIQFKDNLRKDLITFKHLKELLEADKKDELQKALDQEIERINASLQD